MHDVLDLLVLRTAVRRAVPVAAARSVGTAGTVIPARTVIPTEARALSTIVPTGTVVPVIPRTVEGRTAGAVVTLRAVGARAVIPVVPRTVIPLGAIVAVEPRTLGPAGAVVALRTIVAVEAGTVVTLRAIIAVEAGTVIPLGTVTPVEAGTVIPLRAIVPVEARTVIPLRAVTPVEARTLGATGAVVEPGTVIATGTVVPIETRAVIPAVRGVDTARLGTVADRARLIATGALLCGPALLRRALARGGLGTVSPVVRGTAAGTRVHTPIVASRTGIAVISAAARLTIAGRSPLIVTIVEGGLLRVARLEVRRGASALGLVVLGHGYVLVWFSHENSAPPPSWGAGKPGQSSAGGHSCDG